MKLTLREKILITILLAVLFVWLGGCSRQGVESATTDGTTSARYLQNLYKEYNEDYFHDSLPKDTTIDMNGSNPRNIADTMCDDAGKNCVMHFNKLYTRAPRVAALFLLHEQCHIKAWLGDRDTLGQQIDHGRDWRACMLEVDAAGANRDILIDNLTEGK